MRNSNVFILNDYYSSVCENNIYIIGHNIEVTLTFDVEYFKNRLEPTDLFVIWSNFYVMHKVEKNNDN